MPRPDVGLRRPRRGDHRHLLAAGCASLPGAPRPVLGVPHQARAPHRHLVDRWHLIPPKTARGQRIIPLVPWMTAALAEWEQVCPPSRWNLVWPTDTGMPRSEETDHRAWWDLQDAAQVARVDDTTGRRYELHEARHTTATLLLEAGVDRKVVKAILGHSTIVTSRGYQHVSKALARKGLDDVASKLGLTHAPITQGSIST
jgi:integrase